MGVLYACNQYQSEYGVKARLTMVIRVLVFRGVRAAQTGVETAADALVAAR